jgi:hypothetical protein
MPRTARELQSRHMLFRTVSVPSALLVLAITSMEQGMWLSCTKLRVKQGELFYLQLFYLPAEKMSSLWSVSRTVWLSPSNPGANVSMQVPALTLSS